jgi:hypothetical protein
MMHLSRLRTVWLLIPLAAATPARAQTPAQRTVIEAFRDSLERASDSSGLRVLETSLVQEVRRNRNNTLAHLRLGFLALRQADVGRTRYYEDAAAEFQWVTRVAPSWPYGWYGLGLAEYGLARIAPQSAAMTEAPGRWGKASAALARAVQADARFVDILVEDALHARQQRQAARAGIMLEAVRRVRQARALTPQVLAGLGVLEREFGDPGAALRAFETWLPAAGRSRGLALLEIARTRFVLGRGAGSEAYYDGAAFDDSATVHGYRDDLRPIASQGELADFDRTAGDQRVRFLRQFWGRRDAADLRADGERLREHYRRLHYARRTFPRYNPDRLIQLAPTFVALEEQVDDRGLIYVRHGDPDDRVQLRSLGMEPNESWRYTREEGDLVLHFVARHEPDVFRMVESLMDLAEAVPGRQAEEWTLESDRQEALLRSREPLSSVYGRQHQGGQDPLRDFLVAERAMGRASRVTATTSDSYRLRFAGSLGARSDLVVFPADSGAAHLHLAYAVPFTTLGAAWLGSGIPYPLRLRLVAWDAEGNRVAAVDSTVRPVTWTDGVEAWVAGTLTVPVPAGRLRVRAALQDWDSLGTVLPVRSVEVLSADAGTLWLSDLVIGTRATPWSAVLRGGERVVLNPTGRLGRQGEVELAYEVVARAGTRITSQVTLIRTDEAAGVVSSERRTVQVGGGRTVVRERLDPRRLRPGLYRVEVTVTDGAGGLSRRWREFELQR